MKKIRNNKEVKPKWMNEAIKILIRETKIVYQIQKINSSEEKYWQLLQSKKGQIRKSKRLYDIKIRNGRKDSKNFFKHFTNNKKQKSSIGPLHEEREVIATDIDIAVILNNHFDAVFISENLNNVPDCTFE